MEPETLQRRRGFSLVELLVVVGIVVAIAGISILSLSGRSSETDLNNAVNQISVTLREAQSRSISQSEGTQWGVHFANTSAPTDPFYGMFSSSYSALSEKTHNRLPNGVAYSPNTLAVSSTKDVTFSQITGRPSQQLYLDLYLISEPQISLTVTVATSGEVAVLTKPILIAHLDESANNAAATLDEARKNAKDEVNGASWGVRFVNPTNAPPYFEQFYGTYSPQTVTKHIELKPGVDFNEASVPAGSSFTITFAKTSGNASTAATIGIFLISDPSIISEVEVNTGGGCIKVRNQCYNLN